MKIYKSLNDFNKTNERTDITIGNFDGFHSGHRELIFETRDGWFHRSTVLSRLTAITFDPMPEEFFKKKGFFRIMSSEDKFKAFSESGFKHLIAIPFNEGFSKITAKEFIEDILIKKLNINCLTIGSNFRFGNKRLGDINLLKTYAQERDSEFSDEGKFHLKVIDLKKVFTPDTPVVSSSHIRELIVSGDFRSANKLLKNPISITGKVIHGEKRGKDLGYPTANINICDFYPINGIFLVEVLIKGYLHRHGLASWGNKPTFSGTENTLEVYIFNFDEDIYDEEIKIVFLDKLRDQIKFESKEELVKQMNDDHKNALVILRANNEL